MPKYYKKPKGVEAYSLAVDGVPPPAWVAELVTFERLTQGADGWVLSMAGVAVPVAPTDYLVLEDAAILDVRVMTAAQFAATYETQGGGPGGELQPAE